MSKTQYQQVIQDLPEWQRDIIMGPGGVWPAAIAATQQQAQLGTPLQAIGVSPQFDGATLGEHAAGLAFQGVGAFQPLMTGAQQSFGQAAGALGSGQQAMMQGLGALQAFPGAYSALAQVPGQEFAAQQQAQQALAGAGFGTQEAIQRLGGADAAGIMGMVQQQLADQQARLGGMPDQTRTALQQALQPAQALTGFGQAGLGETAAAQAQTQDAIARARGIAGQAAGQLLGAGSMYDPSMAQGFMDPFQRDVIEAEQREMQRLADIQRQGIRAQAVGAGAFGGSREAVQQAELTRGLIDQQARLSAQLSSQGFTQAQQQAQAAFEAAQQRQLAGAGQAGQIGLSAEQLAAQTGLAGGQLGLAGLQQAMGAASQLAQMGMTAEQIAAQTGLSVEQARQAATGMAGQMGLSQAQLQQAAAGQMGQLSQSMGQLGLAGAQQQLAGADLMRQLGLSQAQIAGQEAGIGAELGAGLTGVGSEFGGLGIRQAQAGQIGSGLLGQDVQRLTGMDQYLTGLAQTQADIDFQNKMRQFTQPMTQAGWLSDIARGFPSGQMTTVGTSAAQPGWGTQLAGAGITALGATGFGT